MGLTSAKPTSLVTAVRVTTDLCLRYTERTIVRVGRASYCDRNVWQHHTSFSHVWVGQYRASRYQLARHSSATQTSLVRVFERSVAHMLGAAAVRTCVFFSFLLSKSDSLGHYVMAATHIMWPIETSRATDMRELNDISCLLSGQQLALHNLGI